MTTHGAPFYFRPNDGADIAQIRYSVVVVPSHPCFGLAEQRFFYREEEDPMDTHSSALTSPAFTETEPELTYPLSHP